MSSSPTEESFLDKIAPAGLNQFDAFPKLPSTYKERSGSRGVLTILIGLLSFLLVVNDIGEWIWGWPDYEFNVDHSPANYMNVNVDLLVNMPCQYLSVDLRDVLGDRLFLSEGLRRDGTLFDVGQATALNTFTQSASPQEIVKQSRKSRGLFASWRRQKSDFRPTFNYQADGSACRVYGSLEVKKATGNLHITTVGHGYASSMHVDHQLMNLSHIINDFSFGPYFPDMTQPLTNSLEIAPEPFVAYQYFITVVPTRYIAARSHPLETNQYSVTHYTRWLEHDKGTPGIFFKFDIEPLHITVTQRTTSFIQFLIRVVGVVGGVWCTMGWAVRVGYKAAAVVTGADRTPGIVAAEASGISTKKKWGGGELRARVTRQGTGWVVEGASPYGTPYSGTPVSSGFVAPSPPVSTNGHGMYPASPLPGTPSSANGGFGLGLGLNSPALGHGGFPVSPSPYAAHGSFPASPMFPPSPMPPPSAAPGGSSSFATQQAAALPPPPRRGNSLRMEGMDGKKAD